MEQKSFSIDFKGKSILTHYIKDIARCEDALNSLLKKDTLLALDFETMGYKEFQSDKTSPLDPHRSRPRLIQVFDGEVCYVFDMFFGMPRGLFGILFERKSFVAHNAMFELRYLTKHFGCKKVDIGCTYLATKLLHHALYVDDRGVSASLEHVVKSVLKEDIFKDIDHAHWHEPELNFEQIRYAAVDAIVMLPLAEKLSKGLRNYGLVDIYNLYKEAQHPLVRMELNGIRMDSVQHQVCIDKWIQEAYQEKNELKRITGLSELTDHTIGDYLDRTLDPAINAVWPRTEKGKLSTSADTFSEFEWLDIVEPFSRFQKAKTLASTFGTSLKDKVSRVTERLHGRFKLCGARTGRLSSSEPNLQNAPRSKEFRKLFVPSARNSFIVADFNQIELRVAAELSRDASMLGAYKSGVDLHLLTAAKTSGKGLSEVSEQDRQKAKSLNFGLLFGLGKAKFRHYAKKNYKVDLTESQAIRAVEAWHELYSGYSEWQKNQAMDAKNSMKVRTKTGKLRKLSEDNYYGASANTPVQGTASEVMLESLIRLNKSLNGYGALINTVHDEIVIECADDKYTIEGIKELTERAMTEGFLKLFPTASTKGLVKIGVGASWAEAK